MKLSMRAFFIDCFAGVIQRIIMASRKLIRFSIFILLLTNVAQALKAVRLAIFDEKTDLEILISGKFKPELFWGDNISLLNSNNRVECKPTDRIFFVRHTLDFTSDLLYGKKTYGCSILELLLTVRNRGVWGNPESIAPVTEAELRIGDALLGSHKHNIPRHLFWMREIWLQINLGQPIGPWCFNREQTFTIGLFPFQLGRGIALGDAYAVAPELLGFYTDFVVDQYTPGAKISGCINDCLSYDLYAAILRNKSATLGDVNAKIFGQEFGRRNSPSRGFGSINFLSAFRLKWQVFKNERLGSLQFEPYILYNFDPEQRVEFFGDATGRLTTIGLAGEYEGSCWEFGFDYAFNLGHQNVKGWDRNNIEMQNRNGELTFVNSHVFVNANPMPATNPPSNLDAYKAIHTPGITIAPDGSTSTVGKQAQQLINKSPQGDQFNGQLLGSVPDYTVDVGHIPVPVQSSVSEDQFFNARNRFRDPFKNTFEGWMVVADAAWWLYKRDLKLAVTGGIATGDESPHQETIDGNFTGFVGIQEIYSGKRVRSAFALGGAGKLRRPLSAPESIQSPSAFSPEVNGFHNLVFTGAALHWTPTDWCKKFSLNPNVLAYWEQHPSKKFDCFTKKNLPQNARTYLGLEVNAFMKYHLLKDFVIYFVGSIFLPGGHYADIRGKPLNRDQDRALDGFDRKDLSTLPNLGTDRAITLNIGLEYAF